MKKSKVIGKRQIILALLILTLAAAVYLNWHFGKVSDVSYDISDTTAGASNIGDAVFVNNPSDTPVSSESGSGYFSEARSAREEAREEALGILKEVTDNVKSDKEGIASATAAATLIAENAKKESDIETLIKSKGFAECVAVISSENVNVIVQTEKLLASDTVQIKDIAAGVTGFATENIKIIEING